MYLGHSNHLVIDTLYLYTSNILHWGFYHHYDTVGMYFADRIKWMMPLILQTFREYLGINRKEEKAKNTT